MPRSSASTLCLFVYGNGSGLIPPCRPPLPVESPFIARARGRGAGLGGDVDEAAAAEVDDERLPDYGGV